MWIEITVCDNGFAESAHVEADGADAEDDAYDCDHRSVWDSCFVSKLFAQLTDQHHHEKEKCDI